MKKIVISLLFCLLLPVFTACEISNTDLANSLEGNMTRLVYSVGYLDSISTEDLSGLVNNSSYFTHSSLYNGQAVVDNEEEIETETEVATPATDKTTALNGGIGTATNTAISGRSAFTSDGFRSNTYNSSLLNQVNTSSVGGYSSGVVDLSLLESNANDLNEILLDISKKRGIIMLYCTDLRSGRATLSTQDKEALAEYDDIIEETTNYLNNNTGTLTNYFNGISSISGQENSAELINAKLIRANEVLKTRYAKLDTCLDSLNAIINIMVNSIGYDYSNLYNTTTPQPVIEENTENINNISIQSDKNNNISNSPTVENITENNASTYPMINPQNNTNTYCPNTNNLTNNNCCPNTNSYRNSTNTLNQNNNCCPTNQNASSTNNVTPIPSGDTIVNYNYDGNNSSNIVNETQSNHTPQTLELTDKDYDLTETEIALSGGLVKNNNKENIPNENVDNMIVKSASATPRNLSSHDETSASELRLAPSVKPNDENIVPLPKSQTPQVKDFSDPEFSESEKELTPELLPFTSTTEPTDPNSLEFKPLSSPELGNISFLPFKYQEDNVLKKTPRT